MENAVDASSDWILIVEDDEELRDQILVPGLKQRGFMNVLGAANALEAYRSMLSNDFSLFVLDLELPDESGFDVARYVRERADVGIVMLTGRWRGPEYHVQSLDGGADAYLTKPVDMEVLAATLRSVLRRKRASNKPAVQPGEWQLTPDGWTLSSPAGAMILLSRVERTLMGMLISNHGTVVARARVIAALLNEDTAQNAEDFDPHRLELAVHRLRRKVAAGTTEPFPLKAIRGAGYVFTRR